jgi:outer membrane protein, heavy metal efflux system
MSFAALALLTGCAAYEPKPVDWKLEASALDAAPPRIELSADDVRVRTVAFSPELNVLRQKLAASEAKAGASGWWEDPSLDADLLRILSEPENPLVYGSSVAFTLPLSGIPGLEKKAAEAYAEADRWALVAAEREAAGEAAVEAVTARETAAFKSELDRVLDGPDYVAALDVARRLSEAGEFPRSEYEQLVADMRTWRRTAFELGHERAGAEASLREKLMLAPACEIVWTDAGRASVIPTNDYAALDFTNAPSVRAAVARLAGGEAELDREIRRQYPELTFGPAYSREEGYNRVGLAGSLTLPLWNRNRVGIAEATGGRDAARLAAVNAFRSEIYRWRKLRLEQDRLHVRPIDAPADVAEAERLYAIGELDAAGYLGVVHRALAEAETAMRLRIDTAALAERMKSVVEGLERSEKWKSEK